MELCAISISNLLQMIMSAMAQKYIQFKNRILLVAGILCLAACSSPSPNFGEMSEKYASTLVQYQMNMQLANIVRSSTQRPMSFLDIPNITGTGSITSTLGTSGSIYTYPLRASNPTDSIFGASAGIAMANTFNFSQSSLDNSVFWKSFLQEIPPSYMKYFIHNHIPREVMLSLVVDSIVITDPDGTRHFYFNNPLLPGYSEFQRRLYKLIDANLSVKEVPEEIEEGGPYSKEHMIKTYGTNFKQVLSNQNKGIRPVLIGNQTLYSVIGFTKVFKLCIDNDHYDNFAKEEFGPKLYCQAPPGQGSTTKKDLKINIRSTRNIYDFLGQVVAAQLSEKPYMVTLPPTAYTTNLKVGQSNQYALLVVEKDHRFQANEPKPFAAIESEDNSYYSIPSQNNGYSPTVINLLSQFLTLSKSPGAIPASPAVLIH